jgi:methoxymalonate biosynthesis acyl carrier protein
MTTDGALDVRIRRLFSETLSIEVESIDTDLIGEGLLDSLVLVELLVRLEEEFQIDVMAAELDPEDFRTVDAIAQFVSRLRSQAVKAG